MTSFEDCKLLQLISDSTTNESLHKNVRHITFSKGETLLKQNDFANRLIYIQKGLIKLDVSGQNSKFILRIISNNNLLGVTALDDKNFYPYSAIAIKETTGYSIDAAFLKEQMKHSGPLLDYLLNQWGYDYKEICEKLGHTGTHQMHGRLAKTLLYLSSETFHQENVFDYISRREIAQLAGMSMESMTKILKEFRHDRLIEIDNGKIFINNLEMIERLANIG